MRPLALPILAVLALAFPASTSAKGVARADVCGASGCSSVDDENTRFALLGGGEQIDPPKPGPFYSVRIVIQEGQNRDRFTEVYLPSAGAVRGSGENGEPVWTRVEPSVRRALDRATAGTEPYPASRIGAMGVPAKARVDSVYCPACDAPNGGGGGRFPWWIPVAAVVAIAGLLAARRATVVAAAKRAG